MMAGDIGAFLAIDEPVFRGYDSGTTKLPDELTAVENPTRDPEFIIDGVDPESGIFNGAAKISFAGDIAVEVRDFSDDLIASCPDFEPGFAVKVAVEIVKGVINHLRAKQRLRTGGIWNRAGVDRLVDESQPLVVSVQVFEADRPGCAPELSANLKSTAQRV